MRVQQLRGTLPSTPLTRTSPYNAPSNGNYFRGWAKVDQGGGLQLLVYFPITHIVLKMMNNYFCSKNFEYLLNNLKNDDKL